MTRRPFILVAAIAAALGASIQLGAAQTQPQATPAPPATAMWGGDAAHDGQQPGPAPVGAPAVVWSGALTGPIAAAPVVADGLVYVADASGQLQAMDAGDGYPRWQFAGRGAITAPVAIAGGRVFVGTAGGEIDALDAATGAVRWRASAGTRIDAAPVVAGGTVFVGAANGALTALDAAAGRTRWQAVAPGGIEAAPTVANGLVFTTSADGSVTAFDAASGARRWSVAVGAAPPASPAFAGGQIAVAVASGRVLALEATTGRERWRAEVGAPLGSTPAIAGGLIYALDAGGDLHALDAATGRERWVSPHPQPAPPAARPASGQRSAPAIAGDVVIVGDAAGDLAAIDAVTGAKRWWLSLGGPVDATPAVVGGLIYASLDAAVDFPLQVVGGTGTGEAVSTIPLNPPPPPALPAADRRLLIEDIWQLVRQTYLYPDYRGVDWDALLKEYEPKVLAAPTTEDVFALVEEFMARLNNPHCYLVPPWGAREIAGTVTGQGTYAGVGLIGSYEANDLLVLYVFPAARPPKPASPNGTASPPSMAAPSAPPRWGSRRVRIGRTPWRSMARRSARALGRRATGSACGGRSARR